MKSLKLLCAAISVLASTLIALPTWAGVVVVGHTNLRKLDLATVQRIYTGKVIKVGGVSVNPVNLQAGQTLRLRFLSEYLQQTDDGYQAYWTVRRYVGKGVPPRELASVADIITYVQNTPGAVAYLDDSDVPPGMNIIARK